MKKEPCLTPSKILTLQCVLAPNLMMCVFDMVLYNDNSAMYLPPVLHFFIHCINKLLELV
jgi:hypothetical protein